MLDPQLVHALQPADPDGQSPIDQERAPLPGFKYDGTPWTDSEVETVWAGLLEEASRWTEIEASLAGDTAPPGS